MIPSKRKQEAATPSVHGSAVLWLTPSFFFAGSSYSFGIIQSQLVTEGLAPPSTLAFVGSLAVACLSIFAILNANLMRRFGSKWILCLGAVLAGMGELLASFCTKSLVGLFLCFGVMTGLGYSMIYMVSPIRHAALYRSSGPEMGWTSSNKS